MTETWKLLKDTTHKERSWSEDYSYENGNYHCLCCICGRQFTGHKRRVLCKVCFSVEDSDGSKVIRQAELWKYWSQRIIQLPDHNFLLHSTFESLREAMKNETIPK